MLFNVSGLMKEGTGETRSYEVADELQVEGGAPEPVHGKVEMLRIPHGILVRTQLEIEERLTCARCLGPVERAIPISFEEEFLTTLDPRSGTPVEDEEERDPEAFTIDENHMLDLTEAVRQYREVSIEMAPLCRPDCKGLCPTCGKDLNLGDCGCEKTEIDTRWAGLAALRGATAEGKE